MRHNANVIDRPSEFPSDPTLRRFLSGCLPPQRVMTEISISSPSFVIGRREGVDFQIASQCVSGRHAEILEVGEHLFIRDLGSTNGTYVNRRRIEQPTPISPGDHIEIADVELRFEERADDPDEHKIKKLKKTEQAMDALETDWVMSRFNELLNERLVTPHFQKIINFHSNQIVGFEALARSSVEGLQSPYKMFETAKMVNRETELSIICRQRAIETSEWCPEGTCIFINTHPTESLEVDVLPTLKLLRKEFPDRCVIVEIHEGSIHDAFKMKFVCEQFRDLGIKIAYDDFGAGRSRLNELMKAPPDVLKFDRSLIEDIHELNPYQWKMLKTLVDLTLDVGITVLAEGIEKQEEAEACAEMGFQLGQGYYFGKPAPPEECALMLGCDTHSDTKRCLL